MFHEREREREYIVSVIIHLSIEGVQALIELSPQILISVFPYSVFR